MKKKQRIWLSAEVAHNHSEGIMGAEAMACAVFQAHTGSTGHFYMEVSQK